MAEASSEDFVLIVPPSETAEADRLYEAWLSEHPPLTAILKDEDVHIDLLRGEGGRCLRRYREVSLIHGRCPGQLDTVRTFLPIGMRAQLNWGVT